MKKQLMTLFTRSPLHVGSGSSVGAIDQPVIRERHTRLPVIPGSSLKGVLADLCGAGGENRTEAAAWLFGSDDNKNAFAGALLIGEGHLLAFPVRSAKGCFAWLTSPLALARFQRDSGIAFTVPVLPAPEACFITDKTDIELSGKVVFEEYQLTVAGRLDAAVLQALTPLCDDAVWQQVGNRLALVSDELFAYFAENACEVAQHIRIDDATGTVAKGALFNQENVPSETLFYAVIQAQAGMGSAKGKGTAEALGSLSGALEKADGLMQVGADETTGLGWCSVKLNVCK